MLPINIQISQDWEPPICLNDLGNSKCYYMRTPVFKFHSQNHQDITISSPLQTPSNFHHFLCSLSPPERLLETLIRKFCCPLPTFCDYISELSRFCFYMFIFINTKTILEFNLLASIEITFMNFPVYILCIKAQNRHHKCFIKVSNYPPIYNTFY